MSDVTFRLLLFLIFLSLDAYASEDNHSANIENSHSRAAENKSVKTQNVKFDEDNVVTMPLGCLKNSSYPCVFKSLNRQHMQIQDVKLTLLSGSVVKLVRVDPRPVFEPLVGGFVVDQAKDKVFVKTYELTQFPSYATKTKDQVEVIDGKDFYLIKFKNEDSEKVLLDKEDFVKKIAQFFTNKQHLRIKLKEISIVYEKSFRNDLAVQKKIIARKLASIEEEKKAQEDKRKEIEEKRKKEQKYFFQRTFER